MSLLRVRPEVLEALRRLEVPFELVQAAEPEAGAQPLVRVSPAQQDVLLSWGVQVEEVQGEDASAARPDSARELPHGRADQRLVPRTGAHLELERSIIRDALAEADSRGAH